MLGERLNTGFEDGKFHLPAGHLDPGESAVAAVVRESKEELGITIDPEDVRLALVMHQKSGNGRIGLFFVPSGWQGTPYNAEPHKCRSLQWFGTSELPNNTVRYAKAAIDQIERGQNFVAFGWD